jgi:hypothetical protein
MPACMHACTETLSPAPCAHVLVLACAPGSTEQQRLQEFLAAAATRCKSCCVCAAPGVASVSPSCEEDEDQVLRFTTFGRLSFADLTSTIMKGGVSCLRRLQEKGAFGFQL